MDIKTRPSGNSVARDEQSWSAQYEKIAYNDCEMIPQSNDMLLHFEQPLQHHNTIQKSESLLSLLHDQHSRF